MKNNHTVTKSKLKEKNIVATVLVIVMVAVMLCLAYFEIDILTERRCIERIQENANTVTEDISSKLVRDSQLLRAVSEVILAENSFDPSDPDMVRSIMRECNKLTPTARLYMLLPGDILISPDDDILDADGKISFEEQVERGEYIAERMPSILDSSRLIIRHYVPLVRNGETIAILFSSTDLYNLPDALNIDNFYNGAASVYIIDRSTGDYLMDTFHEDLENFTDFDDHVFKEGGDADTFKADLMRGGSGYVVYKSETINDYVYFYYTPITAESWQAGDTELTSSWTVCVSVPESDAFQQLYIVRRVCVMMGVLVSVVLLFYLFWTIRNTTVTLEKAVLEERLIKAENAERAKTMFLSNMSHDIRTPMNAIIGYSTLAVANIGNQARVQDYLSKILSSSNHLLSLINDVLDMSRIESGRVNIEEVECSLPDMLHDLRNIMQSQVQAKQLNFFIDTIDIVDEDVYCDKLHLNQVLLNLLSNAIKFTPVGGSVTLIFKQKHGAPEGYATYEIHVKDTGIGMSPEFMARVFEPFERESTSTVSGIQGTGLGMAISKNIVDMMGGTIAVSSEKGKGTEFTVTLDLRLQSERKQVEIIKELEGLRSLIVDDDYNICDSVTKMLVQLGLRADWTLTGREAVLHAQQAFELGDAFDAYIIDWQLPDINGIEVVRRIRAVIGDTVPIIILTAYDWSNIEDEARAAGVSAFCNKPIFLSSLRETLLSTITKPDKASEEAFLPETDDALKGKRLLLVEDNELNREIATEILTESGFLIESAEDGTIAVEKVKNAAEGYYDMILMDVQMPVMNGYEATKAIRKLENPKLANIPIVAMTANAFNEDKKQAIESGMNDHIAKPLDLEQLFGVLHKYLRK